MPLILSNRCEKRILYYYFSIIFCLILIASLRIYWLYWNDNIPSELRFYYKDYIESGIEVYLLNKINPVPPLLHHDEDIIYATVAEHLRNAIIKSGDMSENERTNSEYCVGFIGQTIYLDSPERPIILSAMAKYYLPKLAPDNSIGARIALLDFIRKNSLWPTRQLNSKIFPPYVKVVGKEEYDINDREKQNEDVLWRYCPARYFVFISRVGFNLLHSRAIVYFVTYGGGGSYYYLEKYKGKWEIVRTHFAWTS